MATSLVFLVDYMLTSYTNTHLDAWPLLTVNVFGKICSVDYRMTNSGRHVAEVTEYLNDDSNLPSVRRRGIFSFTESWSVPLPSRLALTFCFSPSLLRGFRLHNSVPGSGINYAGRWLLSFRRAVRSPAGYPTGTDSRSPMVQSCIICC